MDYLISYHIKDHKREDILEGLPFTLHVVSCADFEDKNIVEELIAWMNASGREVVKVEVPTSCATCSGWTMLRESVYSPTRKKKKHG